MREAIGSSQRQSAPSAAVSGSQWQSVKRTLGIKVLVLAQSNGTQELEPAARDELIHDDDLHVRARDRPIEK